MTTVNSRIVWVLVFVVILGWSGKAQARAIDDVKVQTVSDGYEVSFNSLLSFLFRAVTPSSKNSKFYLRLKTQNFSTLSTDDVVSIKERSVPAFDKSTGVPLTEFTFEGDDPENPHIELLFSRDVEITVRNSPDLKSVIVHIKAEHPSGAGETARAAQALPLPASVASQDKDIDILMEEAKSYLQTGSYSEAVQLYLKVLATAQGPVRQQAQELLGVARERNGQLAHAAAAYRQYLTDYPEGSDADRVRQRLAGLVTAEAPVQELRSPSEMGLSPRLTGGGTAPAAGTVLIPKPAGWTSQTFGGFSQFYYNDRLHAEGSKPQQTIHNLANDLDVNTRWKNDDVSIGARFTGGTMQNFIKGGKDEDRISALSVDFKSKSKGFYGRVGRQTLSTGGVLGRFDGVLLSQQLNPIMKLNTVFGFPVESTKNTDLTTDKRFAGVNMDWGTFFNTWNFNTFFINQTNFGRLDRRAVGGEVRYFDRNKSLFTLVDYDVYFKGINIALFNGRWTFPTKTTLNLIGDYRKTPLLSLSNSIQGQGVNKLNDLTDRFSRRELKQLALDRSSNSKSLTLGVNQDIRENLQWSAEATITSIEGTLTSGGVDGMDTPRPDVAYTTELVASNVVREGDTIITGVGFTDSVDNNDYTFNVNWRCPLAQWARLNPIFHAAYRDGKGNNDYRWLYRPSLHMDFSLTRWATIELEGGAEWINELSQGARQKSVEEFITTGYRIIF